MDEGTLQKRLGANLRVHRTNLGLSQERLGQLLGKDRTYVGSLERGERNITLQTLEMWANLIEIDPVELLRPTGTADRNVEVDGSRSAARPLSIREPTPQDRPGDEGKAERRTRRDRAQDGKIRRQAK